VQVLGVKQRNVLDILRFIYTGCISFNFNRLEELQYTAKKLDVTFPIREIRPDPPRKERPRPAPFESFQAPTEQKDVNDETPPILHELGLRRKRSAPESNTDDPFANAANATTAFNLKPFDEIKTEYWPHVPAPTQLIDPTKIIKKRALRPTRKINYELLNGGFNDEDEEALRGKEMPIFCPHCDKAFANLPYHLRFCKLRPDRVNNMKTKNPRRVSTK
jgi:hypothetical protein